MTMPQMTGANLSKKLNIDHTLLIIQIMSHCKSHVFIQVSTVMQKGKSEIYHQKSALIGLRLTYRFQFFFLYSGSTTVIS